MGRDDDDYESPTKEELEARRAQEENDVRFSSLLMHR
jgi:hypothetical protein